MAVFQGFVPIAALNLTKGLRGTHSTNSWALVQAVALSPCQAAAPPSCLPHPLQQLSV